MYVGGFLIMGIFARTYEKNLTYTSITSHIHKYSTLFLELKLKHLNSCTYYFEILNKCSGHLIVIKTKFPLYTIFTSFKILKKYLISTKQFQDNVYISFNLKVMHDLKFCAQSRLQFFLSIGSKTTTRANNIHQGTIGHFGFIIC